MKHIALKRSLLGTTGRATVLFSVTLILAFLLREDTSILWVYVLLIGSGLSGMVFWLRFAWPERTTRYLSFAACVLIVFVLTRVFSVIDWYLQGDALWKWPIFTAHPEAAFLKAELVTVLGTFLVVITWISTGGFLYFIPPIESLRSQKTRAILVVNYIISIAIVILMRLFGQGLEFIRMFGVTMNYLAAACVFFLAIQRKTGAAKLKDAVVLTLPVFVLSLSGMKEGMIVALLPILLVALPMMRGIGHRMTVMAGVLVLIFFVTTFSNFVRFSYWDQGREFSLASAIPGYIDALSAAEDRVNRKGAFRQFASRANASAFQPWAIVWADEKQLEPEMMFSPIFTVLIPRIFWPEKPVYRTGWEYGKMIFGPKIDTGDTSVGSGLFPSFYLGGGWLALVLGSIASGIFIVGTQRLSAMMGGTLFISLFSYTLIPYALKFNESWPVAVFVAPVLTLAYLYPVYWIAKAVAGRLPQKRNGYRRPDPERQWLEDRPS